MAIRCSSIYQGVDAMKIRIILLLIFVFFCGITNCYAQKIAEAEQAGITSPEPARKMSIAEQKKEAYDILKEILLLSDSPEREKKLPEIKVLYRKIINKYPDLGLAQESYMRLVILAREENTPEGDAEAEKLYEKFMQKYPGSRLQRIIENELKKK